MKTSSAAMLYGMALVAGGATAQVPASVPVSSERGHTGLQPVSAPRVTAMADTDESVGDQSDAAQISRKFVSFAGSGANARALVTGLHAGTVIALNDHSADSTAHPVMFVPPTGELRYGNVYIALAMAERVLARAGVIQPAPQQIQTVLTGGMVNTESDGTLRATFLPGVLQLRQRGLDWRGIARAHGLMSGGDSAMRRSAEPQTEAGESITTAGSLGGTGNEVNGAFAAASLAVFTG